MLVDEAENDVDDDRIEMEITRGDGLLLCIQEPGGLGMHRRPLISRASPDPSGHQH